MAPQLFPRFVMRNVIFAASLLSAGLALALPAPALAAGIALAMDEVRTVSFKVPVATVYVGNPAIADINMIDARHAFVIGKGFGNTNIVALDSDGKQVSDTNIAVLASAAHSASTLVLNRGTQRATYSCTASHCETMPEPGDGKDAFESINSQLATHSAAAKGAAGGQ
jgi:Flp pilus assembly secretin CpaC